MFCTQCGNKLGDDARFCTKCGAPTDKALKAQSETAPEVTSEAEELASAPLETQAADIVAGDSQPLATEASEAEPLDTDVSARMQPLILEEAIEPMSNADQEPVEAAVADAKPEQEPEANPATETAAQEPLYSPAAYQRVNTEAQKKSGLKATVLVFTVVELVGVIVAFLAYLSYNKMLPDFISGVITVHYFVCILIVSCIVLIELIVILSSALAKTLKNL